MDKNCDNCINSGRPSYEWPCTACTSAYGSAPSKWESMVPATADMVEVVRCKDCKYYGSVQEPCHGRTQRFCGLHKGLVVVNTDTFCSYGERRTDG